MAYSNSQVAHEFAHRTGKKQNGSNMFYEMHENGTATIYSYGHHFAIAHIVDNDTVIVTDDTYSHSTSKHRYKVLSAVSHYRNIIHVPFDVTHYVTNGKIYNGGHLKSVKYYQDKIAEYRNKHLKATKYNYISYIASELLQLRKFCEFFGCFDSVNELHLPFVNGEKELSHINLLSHYYSEKEREAITRKQERIEQREKEREEKERQKLINDIEQFRTGKINSVYNSTYTYLRYNSESNKIETSKGMVIDIVPQLRILYNMMNSGRELKESITVQGFSVNTVTPKFIKIGCHTISKEEADRIAQYL